MHEAGHVACGHFEEFDLSPVPTPLAGAGRLTLRQEPCLFTGDGIFSRGAILAATDKPSDYLPAVRYPDGERRTSPPGRRVPV